MYFVSLQWYKKAPEFRSKTQHATHLQDPHHSCQTTTSFTMVAILGHLTRVIAGIPVPNSPIVNATIAYAHDNLPTLTYNHVMRTWLNGQAIINNLPAANISMVDQEVFAVAAILHDMGWSVVQESRKNGTPGVPANLALGARSPA
jgi:hypothetical protein